MKIMKFGGSSVGSADRIKEVAGLIGDNSKKIVVLSAIAGTTNDLVEISTFLHNKNHRAANEIIEQLKNKYNSEIKALYSSKKSRKEAKIFINTHFEYIKSLIHNNFNEIDEREILAQGELMSTAMMYFYLNDQGKNSQLLPALEFMKINEENEPDLAYIKEHIQPYLEKYSDTDILITQGYICRNSKGEIDNLQRGGSDYSASLIGAAVEASEIQIWSDIDGMHNNDPRFVENTKSIAELSFDEAAELAYFGAKILHPTSVLPAKLAKIPVKLLNTLDPDAPGTTISGKTIENRITAIAAKAGITAIRIQSGRMLLAYGFLRKVFEIFETYKTAIDMITTSEVGVSVTIDNTKNINKIVRELKEYGTVEVDSDQVIICIVGDLIREKQGYANKVFYALRDIPIRMISYGGSDHNISILVKPEFKQDALRALHEVLF